jgi:hypothetical protein
MHRLYFRRALVDAILDGRKRATVRHAARGLEAGLPVALCWRYHQPPFALGEVLSVEPFSLQAALDDPEAFGVPREFAEPELWAEWVEDPGSVMIRFALSEVLDDPRPDGKPPGQLAMS